MKIRYISKEWENETLCKAGKTYDVISIESGWHNGLYKIVNDNVEEVLINTDLFEIVYDSNPPPVHQPLMTDSDKSLMTPQYKEFITAVHFFIDHPSKESAIVFVEFACRFWLDHEDELYDVPDISAVDEYMIVFDILILCDSFDDSDDSINHDYYCIGADQLYHKLLEKIDYIDSPEYE